METQIRIYPQLCKTLTNKSKISWPWFQEPKLDGLRGIVVVDKNEAKSWSRNGKPLWNTEHIIDDLLTKQWRNYVLDGEFFTTDWNLSMSITKTQSDHPQKLSIKYHVWDVIPIQRWLEGKDPTPQYKRRDTLEKGFGNLSTVEVVDCQTVNNLEEAEAGYRRLLEKGYEGGILKDRMAPYVLGARSPFWLKMKPWDDADLTVVDAVIGQGKHQGRLGALVLTGTVEWRDKIYEVKTEVGTGFNDQEREMLWAMYQRQELVGKIVEIKFQEITAEGACRFPVFSRLREDK